MRVGVGVGICIGHCFSHDVLHSVTRDQFTVRGNWIHLHNPSSELVDDTRVDID